MIRVALALGLAAWLGGPGTSLADPGADAAATATPAAVEHDVVEVSPPGTATVGEVAIDNRYGDVTVVGHDGDTVAIEATKRGPDQAALDRLKVQLVPDPSGAVAVTAVLKADAEERPLAAGTIRIDLVVRVPRLAHVVARLWHGRASARGLDRGVALAVDRGDIAVTAVSGGVDGETSFGSQSYQDVFGTLDARAVEGDLAFDGVTGERIAATVWQGQIDGRRIAVRQLAIEVGRGDVVLALDAVRGGRYQVSVWRGDVTVAVARQRSFAVHARAAGGAIALPRRLRAGKGGRTGEVLGYLGNGRGPATLDLASQAGSITVAEF